MSNLAYVVAPRTTALTVVLRVVQETLTTAGIADLLRVEASLPEMIEVVHDRRGRITITSTTWTGSAQTVKSASHLVPPGVRPDVPVPAVALRHPSDRWMAWVFTRLHHALGVALEGPLADEGTFGLWVPNAAKNATYDAWVDAMCPWRGAAGVIAKAVMRRAAPRSV